MVSWSDTRRVDVQLPGGRYPILVGSDLLARLPAALESVGLHPGPVAIVSDSAVAAIHGGAVEAALVSAGFRIATSTRFPPGEATKSFDNLLALFDAFAAASLDRTAPVLALGGGVIGDLSGFAAATFKRGLPFVQIPTTLLAQVDSAVGGKVAVNHAAGKNLIGAFHQPRLVLADITTLGTLPPAERIAGLAEVLKYGVLCDAELFEWITSHAGALRAGESSALQHAVVRSCEIKSAVVAEDERDLGRRAILNLGHTVGHAIENELGYGGIRHGEAVAIGMVAAARIGVALGLTPADVPDRIVAAARSLGLPASVPASIDPASLVASIRQDKKIQAGRLRFIVPTAIGAVEVRDDVTEEQIVAACGS